MEYLLLIGSYSDPKKIIGVTILLIYIYQLFAFLIFVTKNILMRMKNCLSNYGENYKKKELIEKFLVIHLNILRIILKNKLINKTFLFSKSKFFPFITPKVYKKRIKNLIKNIHEK